MVQLDAAARRAGAAVGLPAREDAEHDLRALDRAAHACVGEHVARVAEARREFLA
jgi:hypothetical protein